MSNCHSLEGGNPALTDADLIDVIAYVRTLAG